MVIWIPHRTQSLSLKEVVWLRAARSNVESRLCQFSKKTMTKNAFEPENRCLDISTKRIAILITCHNRREKTIRCLGAVADSKLASNFQIAVFLVDDGSKDGTALAVHRKFPFVHIIQGNGSLYWNGGMHLAWEEASKQDFDYYFWLNDDTYLFADSLARMLETFEKIPNGESVRTIIIGTTIDPKSGRPTYGGQVKVSRWNGFKFRLAIPENKPLPCDTLNGNCALIPREVFRIVGNLEEKFIHTMGDIDYGLRARIKGCSIWVATGFIGECTRNSLEGTYCDATLSPISRVKQMLQPKGLPMRQWKLMTKRHLGPFWFFFWLYPYVRALFPMRLKK